MSVAPRSFTPELCQRIAAIYGQLSSGLPPQNIQEQLTEVQNPHPPGIQSQYLLIGGSSASTSRDRPGANPEKNQKRSCASPTRPTKVRSVTITILIWWDDRKRRIVSLKTFCDSCGVILATSPEVRRGPNGKNSLCNKVHKLHFIRSIRSKFSQTLTSLFF